MVGAWRGVCPSQAQPAMRSEGPPAGRRRTHAHSASNQQYIAPPPPVQRNFRACAKLPINRGRWSGGDALDWVGFSCFRLADLAASFYVVLFLLRLSRTTAVGRRTVNRPFLVDRVGRGALDRRPFRRPFPFPFLWSCWSHRESPFWPAVAVTSEQRGGDSPAFPKHRG